MSPPGSVSPYVRFAGRRERFSTQAGHASDATRGHPSLAGSPSRPGPKELCVCPKWENLPFAPGSSSGLDEQSGRRPIRVPVSSPSTQRYPPLRAITLIAAGERFNALAILATPFLSRASDFNNRRSSLVQRRRTTLFFLAISVPLFEPGFYHGAFSS
jgi:hypothetical protein